MKNKKNILVGVCAGIASYKTCTLVRLLKKDGFSVRIIMTESAVKFVTPLVFSNLSQNSVYLDMFKLPDKEFTQHIDLAAWADLVILAPLTANTLSKIAAGICDNLLTTVICALPQTTPLVLAPAMNQEMWKNPIIQDNISKLKKIKKYHVFNPKKGELACGVCGEGKMVEPEEILAQVKTICKI